MPSDDQSEPPSWYTYKYPTYRWAILAFVPVRYRGSQDYNAIAEDDGLTPLTFATEAEARAAAIGPKYGPFLASIPYPWRITEVREPYPRLWPREPELKTEPAVPTESETTQAAAVARSRQTEVGVPSDLMAVYDNLVPMIQAQCGDLAPTSNPVMFTFIDTCALQMPTASQGVPTDIARVLWTQGLQTLRNIADAALDPSRQVDAMLQLGLQPDFCPNLAVLVYQYWPVYKVFDGRLQKSESYEPRTGVPHVLQVELRVHGCAPVVVEWIVLQRDDGLCVVPMPLRYSAVPGEHPSLTAASAFKSSPQVSTDPVSRRPDTAEEELALMQLPTFVVQVRPFDARYGGSTTVWLNDSSCVTFIPGTRAANDARPEVGFVVLHLENGLVVPTFYGTDSATFESFWPRGTTMVVYPADGGATFKIVVIQPSRVVPTGLRFLGSRTSSGSRLP